MRKKLISRKSAYSGNWRISFLRYSLYGVDSSIRTGLFVYYFRKKISDLKNTSYLFFRNLPLFQISTFSLGQKGCAYCEQSAYYECAYNERAQNNVT